MKVLSLGSLNLDHVYAVDHFVRAGETQAALGLNDFCGGKGLNQSIALARAGARVFHAGKVGSDGDMLIKRLSDSGVDVSLVSTDAKLPTGHAIIQVDPKGQNCILIHGGANRAITEEDIDRIVSEFEEGDVILLQNEISNLGYCIKRAAEAGLRVALNPSPMDDQLSKMPELSLVTWFILNEIEGFELTGERGADDICRVMREKYPSCVVVLTLGKDGVRYYDGEVTEEHGIYDVKVVDTTAAGDTFAGYFLACVSEGLDIKRVLELASKASSLAVSRPGASDSSPSRAEVMETKIVLSKN